MPYGDHPNSQMSGAVLLSQMTGKVTLRFCHLDNE